MLIISRKSGESFIIGDRITVSVLEASPDRVKIGIDAPREVKILRSEVVDTETANREAADRFVPLKDIKDMLKNK